MKTALYILGGIILLLGVFILWQRGVRARIAYPKENLAVTSTAFENGGVMPKRYTGRGEDLSPDLGYGPLDTNAASVAVVMDDMDHPIGAYNHWVMWNVPAAITAIPEAVEKGEHVSSLSSAVQGRSDYGGKQFYRGPKPPFGTHKYVFRVYVLDCFLNLEASAGKAELLRAMEGHILQYGTLTGLYGN